MTTNNFLAVTMLSSLGFDENMGVIFLLLLALVACIAVIVNQKFSIKKQNEHIEYYTDLLNKRGISTAATTDATDGSEPLYSSNTPKERVFAALKSLGCQCEKYDEEDNDTFTFMYQGEHIMMMAADDTPMVKFFDRFWYNVPLADIDGVSLLRKAINRANQDYPMIKFVYSFYENKDMYVHTEMIMLLQPEIVDVPSLTKNHLDYLVWGHSGLEKVLAEIKKEEQEKSGAE